jgi:hypothetical protein
MLCPVCERPTTPLFTSVACDWCDGLVPYEVDRGFIVLVEDRIATGRQSYVFRTMTDAAIWRSARGLQSYPIQEVHSLAPIQWTRSRGTIENVEMADRPFEVFADHRFPDAPYRAFLAPHHTRRRRAS